MFVLVHFCLIRKMSCGPTEMEAKECNQWTKFIKGRLQSTWSKVEKRGQVIPHVADFRSLPSMSRSKTTIV